MKTISAPMRHFLYQGAAEVFLDRNSNFELCPLLSRAELPLGKPKPAIKPVTHKSCVLGTCFFRYLIKRWWLYQGNRTAAVALEKN